VSINDENKLRLAQVNYNNNCYYYIHSNQSRKVAVTEASARNNNNVKRRFTRSVNYTSACRANDV